MSTNEKELLDRAATILDREVPSYGRDYVLAWFQDYWRAGGQVARPEPGDPLFTVGQDDPKVR